MLNFTPIFRTCVAGLIVVISSTAFSTASAQATKPGRPGPAAEPGATVAGEQVLTNVLEISIAEPTRLRGKLSKGNVGLRFDSRKRGSTFSYVITTLSNQELMSGSGDGKVARSSLLNGQVSTSIDASELERLRAEALQARDGNSETTKRLTSSIAERVATLSRAKGDGSAVQRLVRSREYALLPALSVELAKVGMTGDKYPPSFAIHVLAMAAEEFLEAPASSQPQVAYRQKLPPGLRSGPVGDLLAPPNEFGMCWTREEGANLEKLPQCPLGENECADRPVGEDACFGRCGEGCECWSRLCGDCCFNWKCGIHDTITRTCSLSNPLSWLTSCVAAAAPVWLVGWGCS